MRKKHKSPQKEKKTILVIDPNDPDSIQALKETLEPIIKDVAEKITSTELAKLQGTPLNQYEACKFLGVSEPTFRKMVENGTIPYHTKGSSRKFFLKNELLEATKRNNTNTTTQNQKEPS